MRAKAVTPCSEGRKGILVTTNLRSAKALIASPDRKGEKGPLDKKGGGETSATTKSIVPVMPEESTLISPERGKERE